jgi:glycosyltransferase involved in cell wall biosynthesis
MCSECPLVSIGMPVRDCYETLSPAINSLLAQTYLNWELLLIDDGSSDNTLQLARHFADPRITTYSDGEQKGLPARLNQAISMSQGKYFARMDGDDVAYPARLERQVDYLEKHPGVDLVGAWVIVFGQEGAALGKRTGPEAHAQICAKPFAGFPIVHPTYFGHLEWFRRHRYNEMMLKSQDQDLLLRSYRSSCFANLPEILLGYREERIHLKKILAGRWHFALALAREFSLQGRLYLAVRSVLEQTSKAMLDCIAVSSGLNYGLLRHRARPITDAERRKWAGVWQLVSQTQVEPCAVSTVN